MPSQEKIDRTLGGRLDPAPEEMFQTEMGSAFWDRSNRLINFMDTILPPGYKLVSTSGYREESRDSDGNLIGLGSHRRPSYDYIIVSDDPDSYWSNADEDAKWDFYLKQMQPLAQYFGMEADGRQFLPVAVSEKYPEGLRPHGTGAHIHTQSNPDLASDHPRYRPLKQIGNDPERIEKIRMEILRGLRIKDILEKNGYKRGGRIRDAYGRTLI